MRGPGVPDWIVHPSSERMKTGMAGMVPASQLAGRRWTQVLALPKGRPGRSSGLLPFCTVCVGPAEAVAVGVVQPSRASRRMPTTGEITGRESEKGSVSAQLRAHPTFDGIAVHCVT